MKIANGVEMLDIQANLAGTGPSIIHPTLLWDQEEAILVDAGLPGQVAQFREAMEEAGVAFTKLSKVIITHHDMDHIGSLSSIVNASPHPIQVLAHEKEKPYIQTELPPLRLIQIKAQLDSLPEERRHQMKALYDALNDNYRSFKASVDKTVADGQELVCCGGITVIYTPGHTPGHISLYLNQHKILIAGDSMNVEDQALVPAPRFTIVDTQLAAQSLAKLTQYDIETVICYHGGLFRGNASQRIAAIANAYDL
jgi:glyoxylase-like metal-dependent hydrolase (beta-lactamase superfamily II)